MSKSSELQVFFNTNSVGWNIYICLQVTTNIFGTRRLKTYSAFSSIIIDNEKYCSILSTVISKVIPCISLIEILLIGISGLMLF